MPEELQLRTRIWPTRGTKPAEGDEVYSGGVQPISDYDNWYMWAITTDIHNIGDEFDGLRNQILTRDGNSLASSSLDYSSLTVESGDYMTGGGAIGLGGRRRLDVDESALDETYLRTDAENDPVTGALQFGEGDTFVVDSTGSYPELTPTLDEASDSPTSDTLRYDYDGWWMSGHLHSDKLSVSDDLQASEVNVGGFEGTGVKLWERNGNPSISPRFEGNLLTGGSLDYEAGMWSFYTDIYMNNNTLFNTGRVDSENGAVRFRGTGANGSDTRIRPGSDIRDKTTIADGRDGSQRDVIEVWNDPDEPVRVNANITFEGREANWIRMPFANNAGSDDIPNRGGFMSSTADPSDAFQIKSTDGNIYRVPLERVN